MTKNLQPAYVPGLMRFLFSLLLFAFCNSGKAQTTISGTVLDENNQAVSGVTVQVKNTNRATVTDQSGRFKINATKTDVLVFSYVGSETQEETVGNRNTINVRISGTARNLSEIVVTALGITKQARGLGYSTTNVNPDELSVNRTSNVMNALQGKVAGVNISSLGTGPGGTSKIRIRGQSSISGQNNPLIVINGVPIDNTNFNDNTIGVNGGGVFADGGDGLSSINPDDIESMSILKGAPASALYGSRAKDGVIMITTKTKGKGKGLGVTYNGNYTDEAPLDFTDYQKIYGQGENGVRPTTPNPTSGEWSFGEKFQPGMTQTLFNSPGIPYVPQGSRIKEFYRHGQNLANTVTMESSGDKGGMHLSLNNTDNQGIVPNNSLNRKGMNLGFSYNLSDKFSFAGNVNYTNEVNKNPPNISNQDNTIPTTLMALANSMPLSVLDANKFIPGTQDEYVYSRFKNRTNPFWELSQQFHNIRRDRVFGNVSAKYDILPWLFVQGRFGQDYWSRDEDVNNFPTGQASRTSAPPGFVNGVYTQESRRFRETNLDFLVNATKEFGNFAVALTGGGNQMRRRTDVNNVQVTDFIIRGLYTVQNGRAKNPIYNLSQKGVNSLYSSGEVSWNRTLYLNGTVRNDWFSTLSAANRSILYPSVSGAYVFSETLKNSMPWLSFGKIRMGYAEVGSDGDVAPYSNQLFYSINSNLINNPSGTAVPVGASGTTVPNANLRPSRTAETEIGLELKMFNSRVNLDVAAYRKITTDQIVPVQISDASGFVNTSINSGKSRNLGFEVLLDLVPISTKNFQWDFTANTSFNKTRVLSILTSTPGERITIGSHPFNGEVRDVVGKEIGQIAGYGYARDAKGRKIFQTNGIPLRTPNLVLFGSALPKWTGGFLNSFSYKEISLSVFIDYKLGNKVLSGTNFNAIREGLHKMTLQGREGGVIGDGVDPNGNVNTAVAKNQTYWEHLRSQALVEAVIYNGGYWKLRQITLGYNFTKFIPAKWPIKGLKLDLVANNVLIIKKWIDNIDPESSGYGSDNMIGLESPSLPTTRGLGVNLNIKF
ncbi:SusC/RagA family TonB-linked outer membrane protein [Ginsengibacter hankyongi]|uniref:SusC/RagA family TonB-linked outer membrane protein n=1 Tax=Ginsengibacter hankyongi TaxID=2607284 RepID=A0A5J5ID14_9BACT|nr:SusC/RagA family TonB-linked outer membrane protein [Ginsengibacter hankyongi]KAA9037240.1 SusC/RagA family TonB-linked outer membrane protein [Ginsengibacter hankyongi]